MNESPPPGWMIYMVATRDGIPLCSVKIIPLRARARSIHAWILRSLWIAVKPTKFNLRYFPFRSKQIPGGFAVLINRGTKKTGHSFWLNSLTTIHSFVNDYFVDAHPNCLCTNVREKKIHSVPISFDRVMSGGQWIGRKYSVRKLFDIWWSSTSSDDHFKKKKKTKVMTIKHWIPKSDTF